MHSLPLGGDSGSDQPTAGQGRGRENLLLAGTSRLGKAAEQRRGTRKLTHEFCWRPEKSKAEVQSLQTELEKTKAEAKSLQSELEKAKAEAKSFQAALEKANENPELKTVLVLGFATSPN